MGQLYDTDHSDSPMSGDIRENLPMAVIILFIKSRVLSRSASRRPRGCIRATQESVSAACVS